MAASRSWSRPEGSNAHERAGGAGWSERGAIYLLAGSLLYLVGTILVTMICNVPLNNRLASVKADSAAGKSVWTAYLSSWTTWNHVRTVASLAASACFIMALVRAT